ICWSPCTHISLFSTMFRTQPHQFRWRCSSDSSTVTIQPPPFVLNIPGPALYCPDQPLCIEQYNPCAAVPLPLTRGGSNLTSFYSRALPSCIPKLCLFY
uniref:Uncharacterized protein n=1 Tax=Laticauda laticaudata TaxID=8630 RepID=A0A8C5WPT7_LATLA